MNHIKKIVFVFLSVLLVQQAFAGGGWPKKKGTAYFKLSQFSIIADQYFTPSGDIIDIATAGIHVTSLYGEYGVTDRFTLIAYLPFFSRATLNEQVSGLTGNLIAEGDAVNSFGDTDITLKYGLIVDKPIVVSASLTFGLPLGNNAGGNTQVLQTGDGEFNQMLTIEASTSIKNTPIYVSTLVAFNNRTNNFSDELRFGAEVGYTFSEKWGANVKLLSVNSLNNGSDLETPANGIFSNNIEYNAFTTEVYHAFSDKFGVSAAVGRAFSGRRVLADASYSLGVFLNL